MKKLFLSLLLATTFSAANAVPAKPGMWKTIKLADGTEIRVELKGDEFGHYYQAADGRTFKMNSLGKYETVNLKELAKKAYEKKKAMQVYTTEKQQAKQAKGINKISYTGKKKGLIILVQFNDLKFKPENTLDLYKRIINERGFKEGRFKGSVKDYFWDQSYGQMEFDFDVVGPVTMPKGYAYYGQNKGDDSNVNIGELVVEACNSVDGEVDYSTYDWDGDGEVEQVFIVFAGHGEASYNDPNTIWPHKYNLRYAWGKPIRLDNVKIDTYACGCELGTGEEIDGIGTICHEFSHCLGLPDYYDTFGGDGYGTSYWDIMCAGSYNDSAFSPANYTAYERMAIGWLTPTELKSNTQINNMKSLSEAPEAYIIYNDGHKDEFLILENRTQTGWDTPLLGSGLLITHVDYVPDAWELNVPNSPSGQEAYGYRKSHEMCKVIAADNSYDIYNYGTDAYPYNYNKELTNNSTPTVDLFNKNSDGSNKLNKAVKNITKNSDGTISFTFENDNISDDDYELPTNYLFYESFDKCSGKGGNDGSFGVTTSGSVVYDNTGWTSPSARMADKCALFGSTTMPGQAVTPSIDINGEYTLLFKAAPYDSKTNLTLEVAEGNATLGKTAFIMKNKKWAAFQTTVTANGPIKIRFKGESRFYLDKVCLSNDLSTGIGAIETVKGDGMVRVFNTQGQLIYTATADNFSLDNVAAKGVLIIKNGTKTMKVVKR